MQTVFYETLLGLVKLIAPILPHTADEMWSHFTFVSEKSVQLTDMPETRDIPNAKETEEKFDSFMKLRGDVLKALETARNEKIIGKSSVASLTLYPNEEAKALLSSIKEDVKQLFIVSELLIGGTEAEAPEGAQTFDTGKIVVAQAEGETCERCRMVSKEIGQDADHPELCPRCAGIVKTYYQN